MTQQTDCIGVPARVPPCITAATQRVRKTLCDADAVQSCAVLAHARGVTHFARSARWFTVDGVLVLQGFSAMNQLKRKALLLIANNMAPEEVAGLRSIFQVGDCFRRV